jgi:MFS superfamily sulfate permease-like transporter
VSPRVFFPISLILTFLIIGATHTTNLVVMFLTGILVAAGLGLIHLMVQRAKRKYRRTTRQIKQKYGRRTRRAPRKGGAS